MPLELTAQLQLELRELFDAYDQNHDGFISARDMRLAIADTGADTTEAELYDLLRAMNADYADHGVSFDEFQRTIVPRLHDIESDENLRHAFDAFDRMGHGYFTAFDLRIVMGNYGVVIDKEDFDLLMSDLTCKRGDNRVTLSEFLEYMQ